MPAGRPTAMKPEVVAEICERLAGGESLRSICADSHLPAISTVMLAVVEDRDDFRNNYMRAREAAGYSHGDRVVDIVDRVASGELDPNQGRVMMVGLQWAAERMAAKVYSPKQSVDHTSSDGSMTPKPALDTSKLSDETLRELMNARADTD